VESKSPGYFMLLGRCFDQDFLVFDYIITSFTEPASPEKVLNIPWTVRVVVYDSR